ncbi:glycerol-3-phosphate dehydrogenase/oxidase [Saprospira sp. CCB-QB6]|uniref:glycerol-3-phosphate dehydrogenase/oxidase n=1 Tax=Saprospira sp. CCB-QB6 TaxID=3023936 RepID=UPI00234BE46D|nr:glycerol-3-phosphate dehydrogenase/oxidase [Saprospira sp. CCB-QB6]WCL81305.1 glycerol-3-phosphate dehydrogenase/oxidase [Saprospira sp. CCB-QB6]
MNPKTSTHKFSVKERARYLLTTHDKTYDLLVIGGGATGAGIALDAASRGLSVVLIEKNDFAWGTSSRSTKLIHGGLRYLKQLELGLVREVGLERAIVHHNARHIVRPEKMLLPIVEEGSLGKWSSALALWVYDRLAKVDKTEARQMLTKEETLAAEPLLRSDIVKAGAMYYEYRTDDARLTIELIKTAVEHGALALNHSEMLNFTYDENDKVTGAAIRDYILEEEYELKAKNVVNATGPWVDELRAKDADGVEGKRLHLSKGVHLVVDHKRLPIQQALYFDVRQDGRMIFAIPRENCTYIGTTDTDYKGAIDSPRSEQTDVDYILAACKEMFPKHPLTEDDIQSSWAGLRPLIHEDGKSASELSRKDEIFYASSGLISIAGGKLTGYRKMAERVVDQIVKRLGLESSCQTENLVLSGGDFASEEEFDRFIQLRVGEAKQISASPEQIGRLARRYGANLDLILENAFALHAEVQNPADRLLFAELQYALEYESVGSLADFFIRRTGKLYFERAAIIAEYPKVMQRMLKYFNWGPSELQLQMQELQQAYMQAVDFD